MSKCSMSRSASWRKRRHTRKSHVERTKQRAADREAVRVAAEKAAAEAIP